MNAALRHVLGPGGLCAAAFPGYESRPGQLAMAERIAAAIDGDERLLVEAGTGTGKTLAYLIPALLSGRKVVVSTGTKTLQDQIATVDIPRLRAILDPTGVLGRPLTWAVMKGLQNYVCLRRLAERDRQRSLLPTPELDRVLVVGRARRRPATAPTSPTCPTTRRCGATCRRRPRRASARAARTSRSASSRRCAGAPPTRSSSSSTTTSTSPTSRCAASGPRRRCCRRTRS